MKVTDPSGQTWRVSRRWVPWRRRVRYVDDNLPGPDLFSGLGDDPVSLVISLVVLVLLAPFIALVIFAGLELLLVLLVLPLAVIGRVLLGRHWHVEARRGWKPWWEVKAGDWQASGVRIHEVADEIRRGQLPPRTLGVEPDVDDEAAAT